MNIQTFPHWKWIICLAILILVSNPNRNEVHTQDNNGNVAAAEAGSPDIVGGSPVTDPNKYPGVVLILLNARPYCGGSLIHPEWVLSAAHCFLENYQQNVFPSDIEILIGRTDISGPGGERLKVRSIIPAHLDSTTFANDYALIRLERPSIFPTVNLAVTADAPLSISGNLAYLVGWGSRDPKNDTDYSNVLLETTQQFRMWDTCMNSLESYLPSVDFNIFSQELCLGSYSSQSSACNGDSGSPLFVEHPAASTVGSTEWLQIGIASWVPGNKESNELHEFYQQFHCKSYSMYTNALQYANQIERVLRNFNYQVNLTRRCDNFNDPNSVISFEHIDCKGQFDQIFNGLTTEPFQFEPSAFYIGTQRSVVFEDLEGNHLCASKSLWNTKKDYFHPAAGKLVYGRISRYTVYQDNTCGGRDTNKNGIFDTFEQCVPASNCAPPANPQPPPVVTPVPPGNSGGTIDPNTLFVLYSEDQKNIYVYGSGDFDVPTKRYGKFTLPAGWSVKTYYNNDFTNNERCWNTSIPKLQDHEEWVARLESIRVYAYDTCPKPAPSPDRVVMCTSPDATTGCFAFPNAGYYSLPASGFNDVFQSIAGVPAGQSVLLFKEGGMRGTNRCFTGRSTPLPQGNPDDLRGQVTDIVIFTNSTNCRPNSYGVVLHNGSNFSDYQWGMGNELEKVVNMSSIGGIPTDMINDHAEAASIPPHLSARFFENDGATGENACFTGDVANLGNLNNKVSSMILYPNTTCTPSPPAQPTQLFYIGWTATTVDIVWNDNSNNEDGFYVYKLINGEWTRVATVAPNVHTWTDTDLHCSTQYYYTISAFNGGGESARSNFTEAITEICPPMDMPILEKPIDGTVFQEEDTITLVVSRTAAAERFDFYLVGEGQQEVRSGWQDSNQYTLANLAPGKYFWYAGHTNGNKSYRWSLYQQFVIIACPTIEPWSIPGDVAGDGDIDIYDYNMLVQVAGKKGCKGFHRADINQDGIVDQNDVTLFQQAFNQPPTAPSSLSVTGATTRTITITWQDNSYNEAGFKLFLWDGKDFAYRATLPDNFTKFVHSDLQCGESQFYKINAFNQNGESSLIGHVEGKTEACANGQLPNLCLEKSTQAVTFYEHWQCYGMVLRFTEAGEQSTLEPPFDNFFSSVQVKSGYSVKVYAEPSFAGPSRCLNADLQDFYYNNAKYDDGTTSLSDSISSFRVYADANCGVNPQPQTPTNLTADFNVTKGENYTLRWSPVVDASGYKIELISLDQPQNTRNVDTSSAEYSTTATLPGRYQWRVKAILQSGAESEWSTFASFTVLDSVTERTIYLPLVKR